MHEQAKPLGLKNALFLVGGAVGTIVLMVVIITIFIVATKPKEKSDRTPEELVDDALSAMPIIDGRNLLASNLRKLAFNDLSTIDFRKNLTDFPEWAENNFTQTDIPRLQKGRLGAQFLAALVDCESQHKDAVSQTLEQIDVIKRLVNEYSEEFRLATSVEEIEASIAGGTIASLISVGGGHSLQSSIAMVRLYYELGVRSVSLTHECNTPWADSSVNEGLGSSGISEFGNAVIEEMNRVGMIIDLAYASKDAALSAIRESDAPVIFSTAGAFSICPDRRNLDDEVLKLVKANDGLVMVGVDPHHMDCYGVQATIEDIAQHIEYIRNITGIDNVGIGGNFDGTDEPAIDLQDPSKYPDLFLELAMTERWSQEDLEKLSGRNLLRVFAEVEKVRNEKMDSGPIQTTITKQDLDKHGVNQECMTAEYKKEL